MTDLAVIVPTRSRPQNVEPIVKAWWMTGAFEVAQLRFVVDQDDARFSEYMSVLGRWGEVTATILPEWKQLVPKLNEVALAAAVRGDHEFIAFMGDDHLPRSERWAHRIVENHLISQQGRSAWMVYGRDGYKDEALPTWWSVKRDWVMALGRMVPGKLEHLYCDNAMLELGRTAGLVRYDDQILIEHMHPAALKSDIDRQYARVNAPGQYARDGRAFEHWLHQDLAGDVSLLRDAAGG